MTGERILVVDDGEDMRDFVIDYVLKPNGYDYLEARDGLEGFDLIVSASPDLILLDLQMPRLDGIGLLKKLREEEITIPVVLMTFYGSEDIAIEVFRLGVRDYVQKPFTDDELLEAIENALTEARLRSECDALKERLLRTNQDLKRRVSDLEALYAIGKVIAGQVDMDTLVTRLVEAAARATSARKCGVLLVDNAGGTLVSHATKTGNVISLAHEAVKSPLAWQAVESGKPAISEPQPDETGQELTVQVCVPVIAGGRPLGVLAVVTAADLITEHRLNLLGALADYAAIGLVGAPLLAAQRDA